MVFPSPLQTKPAQRVGASVCPRGPRKKSFREQAVVLSYTAGRRIQTMTAILKGNSYNPGNLDIKVSKLGWTQNKYIHIFHHMQNNNPEPQMTSRFLSPSLPSCSRAGGGSRQRGPSRLPTSLTWLRSPGILTKVLLLQRQCEQPMSSRNLQVHGGFGLEIGPESSWIQEMVHPENGIVVLTKRPRTSPDRSWPSFPYHKHFPVQ